jgi:hypothetical protein
VEKVHGALVILLGGKVNYRREIVWHWISEERENRERG